MSTVSKSLFSLSFLVSFSSWASPPTPEYRLKVQSGGDEYKWESAQTEKLASSPFMSQKDFLKAVAKDPKNPNSPGQFIVELLHSKTGRKKFRATADQDRKREYCLVFDGKVIQCYAFPPTVKGLYDKGSPIYGPYSKEEAEKLATKINASLR